MAPNDTSAKVVGAWLTSQGIAHNTSAMGDWMHFKAPVSTVNQMLQANYSAYMASVCYYLTRPAR